MNQIDLSKYKTSDVEKINLSKEQVNEVVNNIIGEKMKIKTEIINTKYKGVKISIVKYDEINDLNILELSSRRNVIKVFLLKLFRNADIYTTDNIKIGISNKSANKVSRLTDNNQQEIALYSDNLIQTATYDKTVQDSDTDNPDSKYRYYNSYIAFGNNVYLAYLNIQIDANGNRLYDINKITSLQHTDSEGRGSRDVSTNNITEKDNFVNN